MLKNYFKNTPIEFGLDEAGRGCLAGPVTAACVFFDFEKVKNINDTKYLEKHLNDSKKLTEAKRFELQPIIEELFPVNKVVHIYNEEIDAINILNASLKAMQECLLDIQTKPGHVIIDGNRPLLSNKLSKNKFGRIFNPGEIEYLKSIPSTSIIKGDGLYYSIAAASVLAKTYRDLYMEKIHEEFPMYHWNKNKGYPTTEHRAAIEKYGPCKYHRMSFRLLPEQLKLDLAP